VVKKPPVVESAAVSSASAEVRFVKYWHNVSVRERERERERERVVLV